MIHCRSCAFHSNSLGTFGICTPLCQSCASHVCVRECTRVLLCCFAGETISESYITEYSTDKIEMHTGAVHPGQRVLLVGAALRLPARGIRSYSSSARQSVHSAYCYAHTPLCDTTRAPMAFTPVTPTGSCRHGPHSCCSALRPLSCSCHTCWWDCSSCHVCCVVRC